MSVILFDSSSPGVTAPPAPPGFIRAPWTNWGMARESNMAAMPQGSPPVPGGFMLDDFEPTPKLGDGWTVYEKAAAFARCAVTAQIERPSYQHILYGAAPITAAQADADKAAAENAHLMKLNPLYRLLGRINVWLALDLSFGPKQDAAGWNVATPKRLERLWQIRADYRVIPVLILGVRRSGGGAYADTSLHTDAELRMMAAAARKSGAVVGVFSHQFSVQMVGEAEHAYAVLAEALTPKPLPSNAVPGAGEKEATK